MDFVQFTAVDRRDRGGKTIAKLAVPLQWGRG